MSTIIIVKHPLAKISTAKSIKEEIEKADDTISVVLVEEDIFIEVMPFV